MSRRFQFSLRGLLGLATVACLLLGGWHLLKTYGNRIEVIGASRVKGRYIRVLGPTQCHLVVAARGPDGIVWWSHERDVKRSRLCCYDFDWELGPQPPDERLTFELGQWVKAPRGFELAVVAAGRRARNPSPPYVIVPPVK
jgi:hypothetical protein